MEEFTPEDRLAFDPVVPEPTSSTAGGRGTSLEEPAPVLCLVSLGHRSGREIFFKGQPCLVINKLSYLFEGKC